MAGEGEAARELAEHQAQWARLQAYLTAKAAESLSREHRAQWERLQAHLAKAAEAKAAEAKAAEAASSGETAAEPKPEYQLYFEAKYPAGPDGIHHIGQKKKPQPAPQPQPQPDNTAAPRGLKKRKRASAAPPLHKVQRTQPPPQRQQSPPHSSAARQLVAAEKKPADALTEETKAQKSLEELLRKYVQQKHQADEDTVVALLHVSISFSCCRSPACSL